MTEYLPTYVLSKSAYYLKVVVPAVLSDVG